MLGVGDCTGDGPCRDVGRGCDSRKELAVGGVGAAGGMSRLADGDLDL